MTDVQQKKVVKGVNTVNPIVAGIAGVVVGGAAVAAAVVMSNKDNQKKVSDAFSGAKDKAVGYIDSVKAQPAVKKIEAIINDTKKKIEDKV